MRVNKLMITVAAVALSVAACSGDGTPSGDETPASEDGATDAESGEDDAVDDASGDADDGAAEQPSGSEVDAAALFGEVADAVTAEGSYEFETTLDAGGETVIAGAMEVGNELSETNMRVVMDLLGTGEEATVLLVDGQFFMEMPQGFGLPGAGWVTFDPEGADPFSEQMSGMAVDISSATDLTAQLAEHPDLLTITEVGSASVDGVETTEYHIVVNDIAEFTDTAEPGYDELSFQMWIDGGNLPRRMASDVGGSVSLDARYFNYGVDVDVEAPPADEVTDLSDLLDQ